MHQHCRVTPRLLSMSLFLIVESLWMDSFANGECVLARSDGFLLAFEPTFFLEATDMRYVVHRRRSQRQSASGKGGIRAFSNFRLWETENRFEKRNQKAEGLQLFLHTPPGLTRFPIGSTNEFCSWQTRSTWTLVPTARQTFGDS